MSTSNEPEFEPVERAAAPLQTEVEHQLDETPMGETPMGETPESAATGAPTSRYAVLKVPDFQRYLFGGALAAAGSQMTGVAAGWGALPAHGRAGGAGDFGLDERVAGDIFVDARRNFGRPALAARHRTGR